MHATEPRQQVCATGRFASARRGAATVLLRACFCNGLALLSVSFLEYRVLRVSTRNLCRMVDRGEQRAERERERERERRKEKDRTRGIVSRRRINERATNRIAYLIYYKLHNAPHVHAHPKDGNGKKEALEPEATEKRAAELRPEHVRARILRRLIRP